MTSRFCPFRPNRFSIFGESLYTNAVPGAELVMEMKNGRVQIGRVLAVRRETLTVRLWGVVSPIEIEISGIACAQIVQAHTFHDKKIATQRQRQGLSAVVEPWPKADEPDDGPLNSSSLDRELDRALAQLGHRPGRFGKARSR